MKSMPRRVLFFIPLFLLFLSALTCLCACVDLGSLFFNVRFYVDGELYETVSREGNEVKAPTVKVEPGYVFDGWYASENSREPYDGLGGSAYGFLKTVVYTITYNLDGGTTDNPLTYTVETDTFTLTPPEKPGYTFVGWQGDRIDGTVQSLTVPRGTTGDLALTAVYEPTKFSITYDLDGGTADNPTEYTVESDSFTLTPPTRAFHTFYAWECDGVLYPTYTVEQGSVGNRHLRAVWSTGRAMFTYSSADAGVAIESTVPIGEVVSGKRITVCAPAMHGDRVFVGWKNGDKTVSYAASYTFTMSSADVHLVAMYRDLDVFVYDKKDGLPLTLHANLSCTPTAVYGGGVRILTDASYSRGFATLSAAYMADLPVGRYTFFVDDEQGGRYSYIRVTDSRQPTDLSIRYDTNAFPDAVLSFSCTCAGSHTYSLDGGAAVPVKSGDVLPNYRKELSHTLTVYCEGGGRATVTREGYTDAARPYYEESFTFLGNTYDYAIESEAEYSVLLDYLITVRGVLDYTRNSSAKLTYGFYLCRELVDQLADEQLYRALYARVFSSKSYAMSPSISTSYSATDAARCSLTIRYPDGLNGVVSTQPIVILSDRDNPQKTDGRPADFDVFPIDAYPSVSIRTLYELEFMPCGVKPSFTDPDGDAAEVYARAKDILRTIVDNSMNDYQKVVAIYRYLAATVTYDDVAYAANDAQYRAFTCYGALMDHRAVCDGYASAFRLLCQIEGIVCEEYVGRNDPSDPASGHAWNKYTIDGVTYAADVTWARVDDTYITMRYLMMDERELLATGHYENASQSDRFTELAADGTLTYYGLMSTGTGYDLDVTTVNEFSAAVSYGYGLGLSYIEVRMPVERASSYMTALSYTNARRVEGTVSVGENTVFIVYR